MLANVFDITSCFRLSLPCGGRLISVIHIRSMEKISTHALRGEGDLCVIARDKFKLAFQSTPSVGRATLSALSDVAAKLLISIHALRGEGDSKNIQIYNIVFVHSAYKIIYFCDSCAFYLT